MKELIAIIKVILVCLLLISSLIFWPVSQISAEQNVKNTLESYVETFLKEHRVPGASIAIVRHNEIFYSNGWGITGESEQDVTTETPFTLGSISKSLTGLAIMKLIEEGKLNIDDPVQKYIPTFTLKDQQAASQITIKHLLSHTSGLSPYIGLLMADKTSNDLNAIKSNLNNLINVNLTASPGEKYQYSSANYLILGALIEEVTNQPYSQFMEEHIFLPLQMKNAAADLETAREKGYFAGYQSWFGLPRKSEVVYDNGGAAYGYITASAKDMAQLINFFSEQGDSILSKEYKELYLSPLFQTKEEQYYGFGLRITDSVSQGKIIWHSGSTPDSHTEFFFLPETGWGGVILTNKNHILEEEALPNLKNGIIAILNGEKPADVQSIFPTVQLVLCGILCLLFGLLFYLIVKLVRKNIRKRKTLCISGTILIALSIILVPLLLYIVRSPWHSIKLFAPDIALLIMMIVVFLNLNGLLSIFISLKRYQSS